MLAKTSVVEYISKKIKIGNSDTLKTKKYKIATEVFFGRLKEKIAQLNNSINWLLAINNTFS